MIIAENNDDDVDDDDEIPGWDDKARSTFKSLAHTSALWGGCLGFFFLIRFCFEYQLNGCPYIQKAGVLEVQTPQINFEFFTFFLMRTQKLKFALFARLTLAFLLIMFTHC